MAAQRKYSPRPILGKGEDLATALHQEVQAISNALTSLGQDLKNAEKKYKDETDKAIAEIVERFKTEITEVNGRIISIAEWSIEITNEIKGVARIEAINALKTRIEAQGDEIVSYAQYIVALNNTVNGKADAHVVFRLENLISVLGDDILAYGAIIQEIQVEVGGKASAFALQTLESTVLQLGQDLSSMSQAVTSLRNDIIATGSPNRLANSELQDLSPWVFMQAANTTGYECKEAHTNWPSWSLAPDSLIRTWVIHKPSAVYTSTDNYAQIRQQTIPVEPGQYYQASCYMSAHRCVGFVVLVWTDGAGTPIGGVAYWSNPITEQGEPGTGGKPLDSYGRAFVFGSAPEGAKYARVIIRSQPTGATVTDSYLFFVAPLFGKALTGQTVPSPYVAGTSAGMASATRALTSSVQQLGEDIIAVASDVTNLTTAVKNPKPGQNILVDPSFQIVRDGPWVQAAIGPWMHGINNTADWTLVSDSGENTPYIYATGTYAASSVNYGDLVQHNIPVVPGQRYQYSVYLGAHRCEGGMIVEYLNSATPPVVIGSGVTDSLNQPVTVTFGGGKSLSGYKRVFGFSTAPAGASTARVFIRARWVGPSPTSVANPYLFIARAFMGTATETQTEPSDWAPGAPGNMFAHLRSEGMVWADSTGEGTVGASYALKMRAQDNTGAADAGLGITAAKINGVWRSQFDITADQFRIISPNNGNPTIPFKIVDNVAYIKQVAIYDGDITNAKIQNLSASKLTAGALQVGTSITSTSYVPGSSGWGIFAGGGAEFGSVHIRGQLTGPQLPDLGVTPGKLANDATMIMAMGERTGWGDLDISFYAGAGGEDRVRKYAILLYVVSPDDTNERSAATPDDVVVSMRMETNGSVFDTYTVGNTPYVHRIDYPGLNYDTAGTPMYRRARQDKTYIAVKNVDTVWGEWAGSGTRTMRFSVPYSTLSGIFLRAVILGYKK